MDNSKLIQTRYNLSDSQKMLENVINNFKNLTQYARGSGRTTKMHNDILRIIASYQGGIVLKILVVGDTSVTVREISQRGVYELLTKNNIECTSKKNLIKTDNIEIIFRSIEQEKAAAFSGMPPAPLRFVEHYAQEVLIARGLEKIKNDLDNLCKGW